MYLKVAACFQWKTR